MCSSFVGGHICGFVLLLRVCFVCSYLLWFLRSVIDFSVMAKRKTLVPSETVRRPKVVFSQGCLSILMPNDFISTLCSPPNQRTWSVTLLPSPATVICRLRYADSAGNGCVINLERPMW